MNNFNFASFVFLIIAIFFVGCGKDDFVPHEDLDLDADAEYQRRTEELVSNYFLETGIHIYYRPGDSDDQNLFEQGFDIIDSEYYSEVYTIKEIFENVEKMVNDLYSFPTGFVDDLFLDRIFLVGSHRLGWGGLAIPVNSAIAINRIGDRTNTLAHELFHIYDGVHILNSDVSNSWSDLNPEGFEYGDGCLFNSDIDTYSLGFVSAYSRCSEREDRAVTFAYMYADGQELSSYLVDDSYLSSKVDFIKDMVGDYDFEF